MKISRVNLLTLNNRARIEIEIPANEADTVKTMLHNIGTIDSGKDYELSIKERKIKRSLDANSYMWVLLQKLAEVMKTSRDELYKLYIKYYGHYEVLMIKTNAIDTFSRSWCSHGVGWQTEVERESKFEGYSVIRAYYGSSTYNTSQMSRLIDAIVNDCKKSGVETMTPDELAKLKSMWGEKNE